MAKRFSDLYAKQIWFDNWQASFYPLQRKPDMHWPEYVDPRMRKYRGRMGQSLTINEVSNHDRKKEVDKEVPDTADDFVTFDGGLYEFDTSAGWVDKWPQPTRQN